MADSGEPLMKASVEIGADTTKLDKDLDKAQRDTLASLAKTEADARKAAAASLAAQKKMYIEQANDRMLLKDTTRAILEQEEADARKSAAASLAAQKRMYIEQANDRMLLRDTTRAIIAQEEAAAKRAASATTKATMAMGSGANSAGYKFMQLGQVIDDLQYVPAMGLRPIINNIMQIAPAVGIAMIAVDALVKNWDSLTAAFGASKVESEAAQMEELGKKTSRTADEAERLNRARRVEAKTEELRSARTKEEKKTETGVTEAVSEYGKDKVIALVKRYAPDVIDGMVSREIEDVEDARRGLVKTQAGVKLHRFFMPGQDQAKAIEDDVIEAKTRLRDARNAAAEKFVSSAAFSPETFQKLLGITSKDKNANALMSSLIAATPEGRAKAASQKENARIAELGFQEDEDAIREAHEKAAQKKQNAAEYHKALASSFDEDDEVARQHHVAQQDAKEAKAKRRAELKRDHGGDIMSVGTYMDKLQSGGLLKNNEELTELKAHTGLLKNIEQKVGGTQVAKWGKRKT